jgi:mycoredoxin
MVEVYGADWCEDTQRTRKHLNRLAISYHYINLEQDKKASEWVKRQHEGKEKELTVKIGERVLTVPSDGELEHALRRGTASLKDRAHPNPGFIKEAALGQGSWIGGDISGPSSACSPG